MTKLHHTISKQARNLGVSTSLNGDGTMTFTHDYSGQSFDGTDGKDLIRKVQAHIKRMTPSAPDTVKPAKVAKTKAKKVAKAKTGEKRLKKTLETGRSGVMVLPYHTRYMNNGGGNGDQLDGALRDAVTSPVGKANSKGVTKTAVDIDKLRKIAKTHAVWDDRYESLNPGMARMNVANRLRGMVRRGEAVTINGKKITKVAAAGGAGGGHHE